MGDFLARQGSNSLAQKETVAIKDLAHHGVLGMKWGHRKGSSGSSPSKNATTKRVSSDHLDAEAHKAVAGVHGVKALSNEDLKKLNERMQLEQTYRNLKSQTPSKFESGHRRVKKVLAVGKTLNDINAIATSPVGKAARAAYKTQTAGKTAYKVYKVTKSDE